MTRLLRGWVLLGCLPLAAQISVREAATHARLIDGKTTVSLALTNAWSKPLDARITVQWLGPDDKAHVRETRTVAVAPGDSSLDFPLPLSPKYYALTERLRYDVLPAGNNYAAFPPAAGILDFVNIADYAFTLGVVTADLPRPGRPYEIPVLTAHPLTRQPVAGVEVRCGKAVAVSDSHGVALLRVQPDPGDDSPVFEITAKLGDLEQEGQSTPLRLRPGDLRINTDKPLYQPGQTMHIRVLETGADGRAAAGVEQTVEVLDESDEVVHSATLTTSRFGVTSTDWEIPINAKSGQYTIEVTSDQFDDGVRRPVQVRRYELPSFRVTVQPDRPYYLRRQEAVIEVRGDYLFGKPVAAGTVRIIEDEAEKPVLEGALDSGRFRGIIKTADEPEDYKRYVDRHFTAFLTDASTNRTEQRKFDLRVSRDPLHVYAVRAEYTPSGRRLYATCYTPDGTPARCDVEVIDEDTVLGKARTNRFGLARIDLPDGEEDEVFVRAVAADGSRAQESAKLYGYGRRAWLETDRTLYRAGDTVRCRIVASENDAAVLLLGWNDAGEFVLSRELRLKDGRAGIAIPYDKRFGRRLRLGFALGATGVTATRTVIFPGVEDLQLQALPAKRTYRPGETARIEFRASAETALGIAVVDQSVFERAATDQGFGRRTWFERDTGADSAIGGITERDLANMDPGRIDGDLQLVAEALVDQPALFNSADDFEEERTSSLLEAARAAFAPIWKRLDDSYMQTLEYPRNDLALQTVLTGMQQPVDPWLRPYYTRFTTEKADAILRFCSAGADKRQDTDDDFCPLQVRRAWFVRYQAIIREALKSGADYPATAEEAARALENAGIRFNALRDPWGSAMRIDIGHDRARRLVRIRSAGPDGSFGTPDDFTAAELEGSYFAALENKISQALYATAAFPRTREALSAALQPYGIDIDALLDPWGRPYSFAFRSRESYTDRAEIYSYSEYLRSTEQRKQITPVKQTVLMIEVRSAGEDGIGNTYDDFTIAGFNRILRVDEQKPEEKAQLVIPSPAIAGKGAISGVVTDASGAVIPSATVSLNDTYTAQTDAEGRYQFRGLPAGLYQLRFASPGFRSSVTDHVPVKPDHVTRLDVVLQVGAVMETVAVEAAAPVFSTETAETSMLMVKSGMTGTSTPRVREYFPETLFWQPELVTDGAGRASIDLKLADSITTWRVAVIGSTVDGRIAETEAEVRAFQPFLVDLDIPSTLTAGDEIALPVPVRNYLERAQKVAFKVALPKELSLRQPIVQPGRVEASSSANAVLAVRAGAAAENARVRVTALAGDASDAIEKPVSIHPDGERREQSVNAVAREGTPLRLDIPASAIPGSIRAEVKFFPSPLARVLASAEALLSRPYGCGEQVISSSYPNLMLLRALKQAGVRDVRLETRALKFLRNGYQRLLGYQDASGGFTYWGHGDPNISLTAYALEFLGDAAEFIDVDGDRVGSAKSWLKTEKAPEASVRALQFRALARAKFDDKQLGELASQAQTDDPYAIAVFAAAALDAGKPEAARTAIGHLRDMARDEQGAAFWSLKANTPFHGWGRSGQVETTALAVIALTKWRDAGHADSELSALIDRGALFLTRNTDASGAWGSSQATVRALTALLRVWAQSGEQKPVSVEIMTNGVSAGRVEIPAPRTISGPVTMDISRFVRSGGTNEIAIASAGSRVLETQIGAVWYEPWTSPRPASKDISFEVRYDKLRAAINEAVTCSVRVSRLAFRGYGMMIAEVGLPPGVEVDRGTLENAAGIDSYEVAPDRVTFYIWPRGAESKFRFVFRPRFAMRARAEKSVLYDYYNPDQRVVLAPDLFTVE